MELSARTPSARTPSAHTPPGAWEGATSCLARLDSLEDPPSCRHQPVSLVIQQTPAPACCEPAETHALAVHAGKSTVKSEPRGASAGAGRRDGRGARRWTRRLPEASPRERARFSQPRSPGLCPAASGFARS
ncbi:hypothetical protein HJG60_009446 [Phyllostomus discolor]|uniref:Uncharacterized protein n=1 Tax=Phyllostomus discolor TaxID=89673 RepID=A0A833Y929_9CHIR|nr:hypothetical protein HJG60_009446 [Phyllostomus discolor]